MRVNDNSYNSLRHVNPYFEPWPCLGEHVTNLLTTVQSYFWLYLSGCAACGSSTIARQNVESASNENRTPDTNSWLLAPEATTLRIKHQLIKHVPNRVVNTLEIERVREIGWRGEREICAAIKQLLSIDLCVCKPERVTTERRSGCVLYVIRSGRICPISCRSTAPHDWHIYILRAPVTSKLFSPSLSLQCVSDITHNKAHVYLMAVHWSAYSIGCICCFLFVVRTGFTIV